MITCDVSTCELPAVRGVVVAVQPNGMKQRHAVYYACDEHADPATGSFTRPLETWVVRQFEAAP